MRLSHKTVRNRFLLQIILPALPPIPLHLSVFSEINKVFKKLADIKRIIEE
jgi:hypothetical protein